MEGESVSGPQSTSMMHTSAPSAEDVRNTGGYDKWRGGRRDRWKRAGVPYLLVAPAVTIVIALLAYPVLRGFDLSLRDADLLVLGEPYNGLDNYRSLLDDPNFHNAVSRSFIFVFGTVGLGLFISLAFALTLHTYVKARVFRALALIPYLVSGVAAGVMWRFMFNVDAGVVNLVVSSLGGGNPSWLANPTRALVAVTFANVWFISPFATMLFLGGLQMLNREEIEAALVDGARPSQRLRYIILPALRPQTAVVMIWLTFASFSIFDIIMAMTGGGPDRGTEVMAVYMFRTAFSRLDFSLGAAIMVVILLVNIAFSVFYFRLMKPIDT